MSELSTIRRHVKIADLALILFIIGCAVMSGFLMPRIAGSNVKNVQIIFKYKKSAKIAAFYPDRKVKIAGDQGYSIFMIKNKKVKTVSSTCEDKLCIKAGWAVSPGESIICLPNKITAEITGSELDASLQ